MKTPAFIDSLVKRLHPPEDLSRHDPSRDWLVTLSLALLVLAGSMLWNAWFLVGVLADEATAQTSTDAAPASASAFEKLQQGFAARDAAASSTQAARFNDPSK